MGSSDIGGLFTGSTRDVLLRHGLGSNYFEGLARTVVCGEVNSLRRPSEGVRRTAGSTKWASARDCGLCHTVFRNHW